MHPPTPTTTTATATDPLRAAFRAELDERTRDLNSLLLRLERADDQDRDQDQDLGHGRVAEQARRREPEHAPGQATAPAPEHASDQATGAAPEHAHERAQDRAQVRAQGRDREASRDDIFDALFRDAHSLKGAARAVEAPLVERAVHTLESALECARRASGRPDPAWFDAAYRVVDALSPLYQAGLDGTDPSVEAVDALESLTAGSAAPPPAGHAPSHTPVPALAPQAPEAPPSPTQPAAPGPDAGAAASAKAPAPIPHTNGGRTAPDLVRVAVDKLDSLLAQAGELAVAQIRIEERVRELRALHQANPQVRRDGHGLPADPGDTLLQVQEIAARLRQDSADLGLLSRALGNEVMALRLVPISTMYGPLERMIRDLARDTGKEVRITLEGGHTDLDRKILEQLRDPMMHMVRNAVDHGIEAPKARLASGKPATGQLRLTARQRAGAIEVELTDDGAGIDPAELRRAVVRKGLMAEEQAAALDDGAAVELIFLPGFSTRSTVTATSGRGVGMDVVREHVQRLTGQIDVASTPGHGTRFTIRVPLSLATTRVILLELGDQVFAVPSLMIEWNGRLRRRDMVQLEGIPAVTTGGSPVPVGDLAEVLERPPTQQAGDDPEAWHSFIVLKHGERRVAILVDRLVGEQEIVMKPLGWPLREVRNVAGTTLLGTGKLAVVLNPTDVARSAWKLLGASARPASHAGPARALPRARTLLVVDDSLTTRTLERTILETAGFQVLTASDGAEALQMLRAHEVDLVVTDIEMPNVDGFRLTEEVRRDAALRNLPVVLVTSLDATEDRERGVAVGADAYIVKSTFSQEQLLDTVGRLL